MRELKGKFENWKIKENQGLIVDEAGNEYTINEIRALFMFRQWQADYFGHNGRIQSLKEHLEKKINNTPIPKVTIDWGDVQERYIHPHYRK